VIYVLTVITAKGDIMTSTPETGAAPAPVAEEPKATKKGSRAPRGAHVAKKRAKSAQKASPAKKARTGAKKAKVAHEGSKTNQILNLLKRPGGVTAKELMKLTGWQPHSVRGFLSGTIGKKMGLTVRSAKEEHGERSYSVKA
jgi:transglutaminase/protease-like cytokinesis protein 3